MEDNIFNYTLTTKTAKVLLRNERIVITFPQTWNKPRAVWLIKPYDKPEDMYHAVYGFKVKSLKIN